MRKIHQCDASTMGIGRQDGYLWSYYIRCRNRIPGPTLRSVIQILAFAHVLGCSDDFIFDYLTYGFCFVCKLNTIAHTHNHTCLGRTIKRKDHCPGTERAHKDTDLPSRQHHQDHCMWMMMNHSRTIRMRYDARATHMKSHTYERTPHVTTWRVFAANPTRSSSSRLSARTRFVYLSRKSVLDVYDSEQGYLR